MAAKCQPSTDIYTMLINVYGKVSLNRLLRTLLSVFEFFYLIALVQV